jgi:hypothetical protein
MLSAKSAVESIVNDGSSKQDIWRVNADDEYHEQLDESSRLA